MAPPPADPNTASFERPRAVGGHSDQPSAIFRFDVTGSAVNTVEAGWGLGEALVSGLVNADVHTVRDDEVVAKTVATKQLAIHVSPEGGTQEQAIEPELQEQPALTDAQVVRLAQLDQRIASPLRTPPRHRMVPGRR